VAAGPLGVRVARKTLLAVAGLVSVHDRTWTTGRSRAVWRWSELDPALADDGIIVAIVERFDSLIGLWPDDSEAQ